MSFIMFNYNFDVYNAQLPFMMLNWNIGVYNAQLPRGWRFKTLLKDCERPRCKFESSQLHECNLTLCQERLSLCYSCYVFFMLLVGRIKINKKLYFDKLMCTFASKYYWLWLLFIFYVSFFSVKMGLMLVKIEQCFRFPKLQFLFLKYMK